MYPHIHPAVIIGPPAPFGPVPHMALQTHTYCPGADVWNVACSVESDRTGTLTFMPFPDTVNVCAISETFTAEVTQALWPD